MGVSLLGSLVGWQWCLETQSGYTMFGSGVSDSRRAVESGSLIVGGVPYILGGGDGL